MPKEVLDDRTVTRVQTRTVREVENPKSDRVDLVREANSLVELMVVKQVSPLHAPVSQLGELSDREQRCYDAALEFLERQFRDGYVTPDPLDRRVESEDTIEYFKPEGKNA